MDQTRASGDSNALHAPPRDPRLQRQISISTSDAKGQSHNESAAFSSPVATQATGQSQGQAVPEGPGTSNEGFARSFTGLAENIIALSQSTVEQANLKKRLDATEGSLMKTKNHFNFPSTISFFQQLKKDDRDDLNRVDEKLREHRRLRDELERSVGSLFTSSTSHKHDSEIESKLRDTKAEAASAKKSALEAQYVASNAHKELQNLKGGKEIDKGLEDRLQSLQSRFDNLDNATKAHSTFISRHTKDIEDCQNQFARTCETLARKADTKTTEEMSSSLHRKIWDMEKNLASIESHLSSIPTGQDDPKHIKDEIYQLKATGEAHKAALENIPKLEEQLSALQSTSLGTSAIQKLENIQNLTGSTRNQLNDINKRLSIMENASRASDTTTSKREVNGLKEELKILSTAFRELQSRVREPGQARGRQSESTDTRDPVLVDLRNNVNQISQQLSALQNVLQIKDDMQFQEMESLGKKLDEHSEALKKLEGDQKVHKKIDELSVSLHNTARDIDKRQTTVDVGLRSLEERYNNLSTEALVKNIITLIQEFYPLSMPAIMEQIGFLRMQVEQLKAANASMQPAQLEKITQRLTGLEGHYEKSHGILNMSHQMTQKIETLNHQQSALWARVQNEILPSVHEMMPFRDQLHTVSVRLNEHTQRVHQDIANREMERQSFLRDMKEERDRLNHEIQSLAEQMSALKSTTVVDYAKDLADNLKGIDDKIQEANDVTVTTLVDRIQVSENATKEEIKALTRGFEEMAQSTKRDISDAVSRLETLEKVKEDLASLPADKLAELGLGRPKMHTENSSSPVRDDNRKRRRPTALSDEERSPALLSVSETHSSTKSSPSVDGSARKKRKKKKRHLQGGNGDAGVE
ncbi:paramyosin, putative [Paecilomyces variotii No. 5]|uniref:Paramyosin, putative n=1 Tax=Byssochlamys spectabilis (strain No. 5 / NBRC 109023) TaxID=1356009 RepID=V5G0V9_BYSSN|nr:paramyosin, putative [Paecilomyces variotii No. 5]